MSDVLADEWDSDDMERVVLPGKNQIVTVMDLRPATAYHLRIIAENEVRYRITFHTY